LTTINDVKSALIEQKKSATWDELAAKYDVNKGVLWMIVNKDYEPKRDDIRKKLGLPERIVINIARNHLGRFTEVE
jgi:hypothetical protein